MGTQNYYQSIASDLGPCIYVHTIDNNMARIQKENIMITLKQLHDEYYSFLDELERSESISTFEQRFMSLGVISFIKRINAVVDKNLDNMHDESL